jgi:hypothetical protein
MRRDVAAAAGTAVTALLTASPAWALCPNCIAQSPSSTLRLVGLFLLVPPAVFFAVAIAVRRILRDD